VNDRSDPVHKPVRNPWLCADRVADRVGQPDAPPARAFRGSPACLVAAVSIFLRAGRTIGGQW